MICGVPKGIHIPIPDVKKAARMYLAEVSADFEAQIDAYAAQYLLRGSPMQQKVITEQSKVYQVQNSDIYNKTFFYNTPLGKSIVSVFFDKNGKKRKAFLSK